MGLRDILTKPIGFDSAVMRWSEPMLFPLRLRGDLWLRGLAAAGAWAGATGVMLVLFAFNVDPPGILTAIGLGAVFGLGPALMLTMMLRDHVGGSVKIRRDEISTQKQYASLAIFTGGWIEYAEWPYGAIDKCVIVPAQRINKPFSVMLVSNGSEMRMIGIPRQVELKKLAGFLSSKGVNVTPGQSVPAHLRKPLNLLVGLSIPAMALLLFLAGVTVYVLRVGLPGGEREHHAAQRERLPDVRDLTSPPERLQNRPAGARGGSGDGGATPDVGWPESGTPTPSTPQVTPGFGFGGPRAGGSTAPRETTVAETMRPGAGGRTAAVGGAGGSPFETTDARGRPVLGLRARMGAWAGAERVAGLEPLFEPASPAGAESVQFAREGYALGALDVSGTDLVDAVRPVFMKQVDGGLDAGESYEGEWIGRPAAASVTRLSGEGAEVIGFHGRGAAVLDAVGLVVREDE